MKTLAVVIWQLLLFFFLEGISSNFSKVSDHWRPDTGLWGAEWALGAEWEAGRDVLSLDMGFMLAAGSSI